MLTRLINLRFPLPSPHESQAKQQAALLSLGGSSSPSFWSRLIQLSSVVGHSRVTPYTRPCSDLGDTKTGRCTPQRLPAHSHPAGHRHLPSESQGSRGGQLQLWIPRFSLVTLLEPIAPQERGGVDFGHGEHPLFQLKKISMLVRLTLLKIKTL